MFYVKSFSEKKNTTAVGNLGESIAANFLKKRDFYILERNYRKSFGEIDIVARKTHFTSLNSHVAHETKTTVHFVEVKTVSYETKAKLQQIVAHETWRPEELVHEFKLNQIRKAAESWIIENEWVGEVQIDVIAIRMVPREKYALVKYIPNVISE